ncbi:MAG TPA: hypothetical protein VN668_22035 [Stellaceae bacterium]|nr:hypothetical protein [Stellaceae bacterium]
MLAFAVALPVVAQSATAPAIDATAAAVKPAPGTAHTPENKAKKKVVAKKQPKAHEQTAQKPAALKKVEPASPAVNGGTGK